MIIDDLIVLGRGVPEPTKDGRVTICLGGYSPKYGFIRIYPTKYNMNIKRWAIIEVEVEKNPNDTRKESWKIAGSKSQWNTLHLQVNKIGDLPKKNQLPLIHSLVSNCVGTINNNRNSLGIVKPDILNYYLRNNPKFGKPIQLALFQQNIKVKRDFLYEPRVQYRCSGCKNKNPHDQQVLEWGFFKWFEKQPERCNQVWENAKFNNPNYNLYFFVGNLARFRNSFIVISVLRFKKQHIQSMMLLNFAS
jgi:hypothetical protein